MSKLELYRQLIKDPNWVQAASRLNGYNIRTFVRGNQVISFLYSGLLNKNTKLSLSENGKIVSDLFDEIVEIVNEN